MKTKDLLLVTLVCVNVALAALAVGLYVGGAENAALAGDASRAGDYVMVSGPISGSREAVLIIDCIAKRANLYVAKAGTTAAGTEWEPVDSHNLAADFSGGR